MKSALDKTNGNERGTDLLSYFVNSRHPISVPAILIEQGIVDPKDFPFARGNSVWWSNSSYLGYLPMILIAVGLRKRRLRRKMLVWLLLMIPFLILRLGGDLRINSQIVENIRLPKHYLDTLLPWVFSAFHTTDHFMIGVLLPLAILSCYGLKAVLESIIPTISLLRCSVVLFGSHLNITFLLCQQLFKTKNLGLPSGCESRKNQIRFTLLICQWVVVNPNLWFSSVDCWISTRGRPCIAYTKLGI